MQAKTKRLALCGIFAALAIVAGYIETLIPFDFAVPGIKLGIANIVILCAVYILSPAEALLIAFFKCGAAALLFGTPVTFFYSVCGTMLSLAVMLLLKKSASPVGVSVAGAVFHNFGQLIAASFMLKSAGVFYYFPVLIIAGIAAGLITGFAAKLLLKYLKNILPDR